MLFTGMVIIYLSLLLILILFCLIKIAVTNFIIDPINSYGWLDCNHNGRYYNSVEYYSIHCKVVSCSMQLLAINY